MDIWLRAVEYKGPSPIAPDEVSIAEWGDHLVPLESMAKLAGLAVTVTLVAWVASRLPEDRRREFRMVKLGPADFSHGVAHGINNDDWLVGVKTDKQKLRAAIWECKAFPASPCLLGSLEFARGINNLGFVTGNILRGSRSIAALWDSQRVRCIGRLGISSTACDVNDPGQVVGFYLCADGNRAGFIWDQDKGMRDLGELVGCQIACALGVNDAGQIVGTTADDRAFLWTPSCGLVYLCQSGAKRGSANGINNFGQVVGHVRVAGKRHAFLWDARDGMVLLESLQPPGHDWRLTSAHDINDRGLMIVDGYRNGEFCQLLVSVNAPCPPIRNCQASFRKMAKGRRQASGGAGLQ